MRRASLLALLLAVPALLGQGADDYARAAKLYSKVNDAVPGQRLDARWLPDGTLAYRRADGKLVRVGADGKRGSVEKLPARSRRPVRPWQAPSPSGNRAPKGGLSAFVRDRNVFLRQGKEETALTRDGTAKDGYSGEFVWSPDGSRFVALRIRAGQRRVIHLLESSPRGSVVPRLHTLRYDKPGDDLDVTTPRLFDARTKKEIPLDAKLWPQPWSIDEFRWADDSKSFTFAYNARGHQALRIIEVDAATGKARAVVDEASRTFIDYAHKRFCWHLPGEIVWMSERDGWNHLYLYDARTGKAKNAVTSGRWAVRGVDRVDAEARQVWFRAGGIRPGQSPYHVHLCRVGLDGKGLVVLTEGDGTHSAQWSPDRKLFVDTWSRVDLAPVHELRSGEGKLVAVLEKASLDGIRKTGWRTPERFAAKGRDGKTDIWA